MKRTYPDDVAPIGIMDSGLGGLTIWREIRRQLPHESTIYVADHEYRPYGEKSVGQIRRRVGRVITYLLGGGAKIIVIACNTATVAGIDVYRRWFPGVPIIGVVPVVKAAAALTKTKRFAVLSTPFTASSSYQKRLIRTFAADCRVANIGCPGLTSPIETGKTDGRIVMELLQPILARIKKEKIDVIALGCTHYPFLKDTIQKIVGEDVMIIDSGGAIARHVARILDAEKLRRGEGAPYTVFYTTGDGGRASRVASKLMGEAIRFTYERV